MINWKDILSDNMDTKFTWIQDFYKKSNVNYICCFRDKIKLSSTLFILFIINSVYFIFHNRIIL